ncbi:pyrroline-5-carboxylate reductase [Arenivirga flava]|uniref:Pyrroline-5-carboxylate reductase n=1 Tax=Arenivirga flava TaxID=1930060 RepID=A0AA37XBU8_9MICO|nr:pyrroline-5-carboxylate reductase [Arenivirga flava]GMA29176.1 pyrroline-5-carboxylate reductase [Arenivirga flava]
MTTTLPAIAILGTGSMGGAILSGLLDPSVVVEGGLRVTNRTAAKADALRTEGVASYATEVEPQGNLEAVRGAGVVLLAVKPAGILELAEQIAPALEPGAIVVSVAAGVTIASIEARLPEGTAVLRAMPNTPSVVRLGVTGVSAGSAVSDEQAALAASVFATVGEVVELPESQIDALSAISGSGPAYVFFLIEQYREAARRLGFDEAQASVLVDATFRGASELLAHEGLPPEELRRRVTSPKGTTERAVAVLEGAGLADLFEASAEAAIARAKELAAG